MPTRNYRLEFFKGECGAPDSALVLSEMFERMLGANGADMTRGVAGYTTEIRDLTRVAGIFRGVLAKYRTHDLPHKAAPGRRERTLGLGPDEGLMEKNHFLYVPDSEILVYQRNHYGSGEFRFGNLMTQLTGETVTFLPILQAEPMRRLSAGGARLREVEVAVARPGTAALADANNPNGDWSDNVIGLLAKSGAHKIRVRLQTDARVHDGHRFSAHRIFGPLRRLMEEVTVNKAAVRVERGGEDPGWVDLLADRITDQVEVETNGRYPNSIAMWRALGDSWNLHRRSIEDSIGEQN